MAYSLSNICTKNYWNQTTTVKIIIGGLVTAYSFEIQCTYVKNMYAYICTDINTKCVCIQTRESFYL